jgi:hypothetical protein
MNYTTTTWASTGTTSSTSFTFVSGSTGTSTTSVSAPPVEILPLRAPSIESQPGWLSPDGDYYPVDYPRLQRHDSIAAAIIRDLLSGFPDMINDQNRLQALGWIRVDHDSIMPKDCKSNRKQRNTLSALLRLDGDGTWHSTKKMITTFAFKQARKKK